MMSLRISIVHQEAEAWVALRASLQNSAEARIRQVRQIWTTTCWGILVIFPYMSWSKDGVHGGFWAGDDFVEGLITQRGEATTKIGTRSMSDELGGNVSTSPLKAYRSGGGSLRGAEPYLMRVIKTIKQVWRREPEEPAIVNRAASPFA